MRKGSLMTVSLTQDTEIQAPDKRPGSAWGNHPPIKFWFLWSHKQLIRRGSLMSWIILLTLGKCGLTGVLWSTAICSRLQICAVCDGKWLCEAPGGFARGYTEEQTLSGDNAVHTTRVFCTPTWKVQTSKANSSPLGSSAHCHSRRTRAHTLTCTHTPFHSDRISLFTVQCGDSPGATQSW